MRGVAVRHFIAAKNLVYATWFVFCIFVIAQVISLQPGLIRGHVRLHESRFEPAIVWSAEQRPPISEPTYLLRHDRDPDEAFPKIEVREPQVIWRSPPINHGIHTAAKSSAAVDESGIYVGGDSGWIWAFEHDGQVRWRVFAGASQRGIHGTAALDQDSVYIGAYNGRLYRIAKASGEVIFIAALADAIGTSPWIQDQKIYVGAETGSTLLGRLYVLEQDRGEILARSAWIDEQTHSSPMYFPNSRMALMGANDGHLYAYGAGGGSPQWYADVGGAAKGPISRALWRGLELALLGTWNHRLYAFRADTGELLWSSALAGRSQGAPILERGTHDQRLVIVNTHLPNEVIAVRLSDGRQVWRRNTEARINHGNLAPVTWGVNSWGFLLPCRETRICLAEGRSGKILWSVDLGRGFSSTPTVHNGRIHVVLEAGELVVLGVRK
ncbi:MAG TPA: PQQ-binding-like beta-propeller repeat protein [Pseudobdellovibrionaceae bacterium]|nr:PQQ-binding-like beta-propeller repeat protein [Pseudobdellovibrionaceae bacterium]